MATWAAAYTDIVLGPELVAMPHLLLAGPKNLREALVEGIECRT